MRSVWEPIASLNKAITGLLIAVAVSIPIIATTSSQAHAVAACPLPGPVGTNFGSSLGTVFAGGPAGAVEANVLALIQGTDPNVTAVNRVVKFEGWPDNASSCQSNGTVTAQAFSAGQGQSANQGVWESDVAICAVIVKSGGGPSGDVFYYNPAQISGDWKVGTGQNISNLQFFTCTRTQSKGTLKIKKVSIGGNGTFSINATPNGGQAINYSIQTSGGEGMESKDVDPGTYTISETPPNGWTPESIKCGGQTTDQAVVTANQTTTCVVTNKKVDTGSLKIKKKTLGGNNDFDFEIHNSHNTLVGTADDLRNNQMQTFSNLPVGNYTISEIDIPAGWTLIGASCGQLNGNSVTINVRKNRRTDCTFTNKFIPDKPSIKVCKISNGGTGEFKFEVDRRNSGADTNFEITTTTAGQKKCAREVELIEGKDYEIKETAFPSPPAGWSLETISCTSNKRTFSPGDYSIPGKKVSVRDVKRGEDIVCTFTNKFRPPKGKIKIKKKTIGGNGKFDFEVRDSSNSVVGTADDLMNGGMKLFSDLPVGDYTITELNIPAGWRLTGASCGKLNGNSVSIKVLPNKITFCEFANKLEKGSIKITKKTIGGDDDFDFEVRDSQDTVVGTADDLSNGEMKTFADLPVGDYTISEINIPVGWTLTGASCGKLDGSSVSIEVKKNQTTQCEFTNTRQKGSLKITKVTVGGDDDFDFEVKDSQNTLVGTAEDLSNGEMKTFTDLPTGDYTVTEINIPTGWTLTGADCGKLDGNSVSVEIEADETTQCIFTNTRDTGDLKITKVTVGGDGKFDFEVRNDKDDVVGTADDLMNGGMQNFTGLPTGDYTIEEINIPVGWELTGADCGQLDGNSLNVTVSKNEPVECTFTNTLPPSSLTIVKKIAGSGDTTKFSFTNNGPEAPANFSLGDGDTRVFQMRGKYVITEVQSDSYKLTALSCKGQGANGQGDSIDVAGRRATVQLDAGENITCTFTNRRLTGSISVRKTTIGGDGTFSFSVSGQSKFTLRNGDLRKFANLTVGQYTIRETNLPNGWELQNVSCTGGGNKQGNGITVNLSANQTITCTFTNFKKRDDRMREVTRLFIHRRVDNLLTHGPDRARLLRRLQPQDPPACGLKDDCSSEPPPPLKLGAAGTGSGSPRLGGVGTQAQPDFGNPAYSTPALSSQPFGQSTSDGLFANQDDDQPWNARGGSNSPLLSSIVGQLQGAASGGQSFKFGTSLSELRESAKAAQLQEEQKKLKESGLDYNGQMYNLPKNALHQRLDVWVEGQLSGYNDSTGGLHRDGSFRILYVGADYAIAPGILVGALVQVDDTREDIDDPTLLGEVEGTGWMVGPYLGIRLTDTLYFDARAAWGTSDNDIWLQDAATGWRSGSFDTDRWLANANLTGNYQFGSWRLSPQVGVAYGSESYDTYFNSLGQAVDGGEAKIGRVTGGAEVGYQFRHADGSVLEPHIGVKGIWNFQTDDLVVNGVIVDTDESRAQVEGGLLYRTPSGFAVRGALAYDGIGADDFESYTGQLWVNIPLN